MSGPSKGPSSSKDFGAPTGQSKTSSKKTSKLQEHKGSLNMNKHAVPEVRAKTQAGGPRKKRDPDQGAGEDALHTSRSISKASLGRPSSPSSLVEWGSHGGHGKKPTKFDHSSDKRSDKDDNHTPRTAGRKKKAVQSANPHAQHQAPSSTFQAASPFSPQHHF